MDTLDGIELNKVLSYFESQPNKSVFIDYHDPGSPDGHGQVEYDLTFEDWLNDQTPEAIKQILETS